MTTTTKALEAIAQIIGTVIAAVLLLGYALVFFVPPIVIGLVIGYAIISASF